MWVEPLVALTVRLPEGIRVLEPGQPVELTDEQTRKLLAKAPGKVQVTEPPLVSPSWKRETVEAPLSTEAIPGAKPPASPIKPGWLVAYRGPGGKLRGGCDDREHGTVQTGERREAAWTFTLTDGTVLPARAIVSVAQVAQNGRIVAAWTVRNFGLDGERQCLPWRVSESDR